jgi:alpha-glucosidase (family GH31 glycosyl hydrolase)
MKLKMLAILICITLYGDKTNARAVGTFYNFNLQFNAAQNPSNNFILQNFTIHWNSSTGNLFITHQNNPSKILWQNIAGKGFCGAAQGNETITESRGSFTIVDAKSNITQTQTIESITLVNNQLTIKGQFLAAQNTNYTLSIYEESSNQLHFDLQTENINFNRLYLSYACETGEQFFGFGEQPSHLNHKGNRVPVLVQEQGIGRGDNITDNAFVNGIVNLTLGASVGDDYTSYKVVPQYISSKSNAFFLKNYEYSEFDFTKNNQIQIELYAGKLEGNLIYAENPYQAIEEYTSYCGRMQPLPAWIVSGAIIGMQGGTAKLYDIWQKMKNADVPVIAFWTQDWIGQRTTLAGKQLWWNWELDNDRYPNWNLLHDSLSSNSISLMGYINPFLVDVTAEKSNYRRDMYKEATQNNYLVLNDAGQPYQVQNTSFTSGVLDLSDTGCVHWIKDIIKDEMLARGLKGWMADFAEALPFDVELHSGESTATFHNKYPEVWVKINKEAINESNLKDTVVFFSRAGYTKSPKYATLFWQGDQLVGWGKNDGLKSAVTGLLSGGLSGFTLNHSDIGGYTSITVPFINYLVLGRSKELLRRWMEMAAFTPVYRTHEGLGPDKNYQVYQDTATAKHFARNAKIYRAWLFYRKQLMEEAAQKGYPICRPLFLDYPNDVNTYSLSTQFMVGSELLVAPVLDQNKTTVNVYLPNGNWVNIWTNQVVNSTGQNYTVTGLPDRAAVFYKQGSAVGLQFKQNLMNEGIN